jgi:hypothetical protein
MLIIPRGRAFVTKRTRAAHFWYPGTSGDRLDFFLHNKNLGLDIVMGTGSSYTTVANEIDYSSGFYAYTLLLTE